MITIRAISPFGGQLLIENNVTGETVKTELLGRDPSKCVKIAELVLTAAGYKPDMRHMYIDDALIVLNMYAPDEDLPTQIPSGT